MSVRLCLLGVLLLSTAALPAGQAGPDQGTATPVFRTSADLVTIDAVVTDGDGRHVAHLAAADFEVTVGGKKQDLQQAIYVKTEDQPRVLAAARAATPTGTVAVPAPARSEASVALRKTGLQPDRIARTIALVVDDLGLSFRSTVDVRNALHKYIDTQMQPGDLVAIVRTAGGSGSLQQFTTDKRLLHMAADRVQWDFRSRYGVVALEPADTSGAFNRVPDLHTEDLRDAMASGGSFGALSYIARGVAELPGRKCIVFLSDGFSQMFDDRVGSGRVWRAMSRMLAQANAAGVVVSTVHARGLETGGLTAEDNPQRFQTGIEGTYDAGALVRGVAGDRRSSAIGSQESLRFIAEQTGGLAVENNNDLNLGIARVLEDQRGYYLLGYAAPKGAPRSGWDQNRVKVRVKRPGTKVRARQGFFGPTDPNEPKGFGFDPLTRAALSPFASGAITARLTSMFGHDAKQGAYIRSLLFIDTNDLHFAEDQPGRHRATFLINLLAVGDNGIVLAEWRRLVPVALNDEQFQLAKERGIVYSVRTRVREQGGYQMRAAVRDVHTDQTGSASQFVEIPKVGSGKLALSGVLLKGLAEPDAALADGTLRNAAPEGLAEAVLLEPQVRVLEPGTEAVYAYEIYDGLEPREAAGLQMATALLREGEVVYQSPFSPVTATPRKGRQVRAIPIAGKLALGKDMPAGPYTLEVIVRGKNPKKLERRQWLDFEVRR